MRRFACFALGLAFAGGSGTPDQTAASAAPSAQRPVTLTGTRTVVTSGRPRKTAAAGTYRVTETDTAPGVRLLVFDVTGPVPNEGIQPVSESVHSAITFPYGTPVESATTDTVTGIDRGAHQVYAVNDVRTVTSTNIGEVAGIEHIVEYDLGTNGVVIDSMDFTRTTYGSSAFDEAGSIATAETHTLRVRSDFSAVSHDQIPGFYLIDKTVGIPTLSEGDRLTVSVTTASQGRTIGNVPIVTKTVVAPLWFTMQAMPTMADHRATPNVPVARECGFADSQWAKVEVRDVRNQIDPTGSARNTVHDVFYDANGTVLCRIARIAVAYADVTTGERTGEATDVTVVSRAPAVGSARRARTGTR
jgi:hypothetical protein